MSPRVFLAVALLLLASPGAAVDPRELPAVARPRFVLGERTLGSGTAFFVPAPGEVGVAAVTTAHGFERAELVRADEVFFHLGRSGEAVAVASRLLAPPGRPFSEPGGTLRDDYLVFGLDLAPRGARVLRLDPGPPPRAGDRVRLLGVPANGTRDEDDLFGSVRRVTDTRIEVDLDVPADLRGWGGAPVLRHPGGEVVGVLQAAWPDGKRLRLGVAPIDGIRDALAHPLAGGLGRPFAAFPAEEDEEGAAAARLARSQPAEEPGGTAPSAPDAGGPDADEAADDGAPRADADADAPARAVASTERDAAAEASPETSPAPASEPARVATARGPEGAHAPETPAEAADAPETLGSEVALSARRAAASRVPGEPLLGQDDAAHTQLRLQLETPASGDVVGEAEVGAFVAGRALAVQGELKRFDVILVLDTSGSSAQMTGVDVNGNGVVGRDGLGGLFGGHDAGDSILAAEVAAARRLLASFDPRTTRVGLVSFSGSPPQAPGVITLGARPRPAALVEEPLTRDYGRVEKSLERVLARGPDGMTNMAEAVDKAWLELTGLRGGLSEVDEDSEKVVLFLTDGQPTAPYDPVFEADNVRAVLRAAERARKMDVTIHAFAIGPEALEGPVATVEMAARTGGSFTPVREPGDIVDVIDDVSLADVERIEVRNLTTGEEATELQLSPDGSFAALVPLRTGRNRIEVVARTENGVEQREEVELRYAPGAPPPTLPRELLTKRTRLLERRLVSLRRERMASEREETERTRKELELEIRREREAARERADAQRKALEIEPEIDDPGPPGDGAEAATP